MFVGDLVDRGPDSVTVVNLVKRLEEAGESGRRRDIIFQWEERWDGRSCWNNGALPPTLRVPMYDLEFHAFNISGRRGTDGAREP